MMFVNCKTQKIKLSRCLNNNFIIFLVSRFTKQFQVIFRLFIISYKAFYNFLAKRIFPLLQNNVGVMFSTRRIEGGLGLIPLPWIREINDFQVFFWPQHPAPRQIPEYALEFFAGNSLFLYCIFETTVILLRNYSEIFRIHTFFTLTFQNSDIFYSDFSEF